MITKEIRKLLKEKTGRYLFDSGDYYGRHWERNQNIDFELEPPIINYYYNGEYEFSIVSTYHYLCEILEVDYMSESINNFLEECNEYFSSWEAADKIKKLFKTSRLFNINKEEKSLHKKSLLELFAEEVNNIKIIDTVNTYKYESNLSQILQFNVIVINLTPYVLLQIHNGADIRSGYTSTKCYKLKGYLTGTVELLGEYVSPNKEAIEISNTYDGQHITKEDGSPIKILEEGELYLDFYINDFIYMYLED